MVLGRIWGGEDLKPTKSFPNFRLRGHPVALPWQAEAREASFPFSLTPFLISKVLKVSDVKACGLTWWYVPMLIFMLILSFGVTR